MLFLIGSIFFMVLLAVCFGAGARAGANSLGLNAIFRLTGGILAIILAIGAGWLDRIPELWALTGWQAPFAGFFYWLSGYAAIKSVSHGPLGVTWTVSRCSVVIPAMASILIWHEVPIWPLNQTLVLRLAGLALTVLVVFLIGWEQLRKKPVPGHPRQMRPWVSWLTVVFCAQGAWEICLRASATLPNEAARGFFVLTVFTTAMLLATIGWAITRPPLGRTEIIYGGLAGLCGFLGSGLRPWALRDLPGILVFPLTSIGVLLLVQVADSVLWKQHPGRRGILAIGAAMLAITCLTL